jgi:inorganic phosphate transporter, PiT family
MPESSFIFLIIAIALAFAFDIMNGFHDAANSIATVVSTRVLPPLTAVVWAAFFNFVAILIFGPVVAETVSQIIIIEFGDPVFVWVIFSGLIGAIVWDLITWWLGLPTSSSHALIGGLAGSGIANAGWGSLHVKTIVIIVEFIFLSPLIGYACGFLLMSGALWLFQKQKPYFINKVFKKGQLISAALYSIGHGANDAQKTMGIILALLIAGGILKPSTRLSLYSEETLWIILSCQIAMSIGTLLGGWRIVKTVGMKIAKIKPVGGFCAETAGAITLYLATFFGIPVSTTHTITGAIVGVGSTAIPFSRIKWGIATRIIWAWLLTIPGSGVIAAIVYWLR